MSDLPTLLPPNAKKVEYDLEQLSARLQGMAEPVQGLWDAETCPEHLLPYLAWALSVEVWDSSWPETNRRQVLVDAVQVHRRKGTAGAVHRALSAIGFRTDISEWFEYGGEPHTFKISIFSEDVLGTGFQLDDNLVATVRSLIEDVKPVRSHFMITIGDTIEHKAYLRAAATQAHVHRLALDLTLPKLEAHGGIYVRAARNHQRIDTKDHIPAARTARADARNFVRTRHFGRTTSRITHDFHVREGAAYAV